MSKPLDVRAFDVATTLSETTLVSFGSVEQYVLYWARNPKPGSFFAKFTRIIRLLPDALYLWALRKRRYGGDILFKDRLPVAHGFYQQHGDEMHLFSVEVDPRYRNLGYANKVVRAFLLEMGKRREIEWLRISAGGDAAMRHMWEKTLTGGYDLPYRVAQGDRPGLGWVRIIR